MAKLSSISYRSHSNKTSKLLSRLSRRKVTKKTCDEILLGTMFIKCLDKTIIDETTTHNLIINNTTVSRNLLAPNKTACMEFNGINSAINIADDGSFYIGLEDFTIDWWEYKFSLPIEQPLSSNISTKQALFYKDSLNDKQPYIIYNTTCKSLFMSSNGYDWDIANNKYMGTIQDNVWTHWAIVRAHTNFYTFKNGVLKNIWVSDAPVNDSNSFLTIGKGPNGNNFYGCITNFRFVKCQALWTDEFSPTACELFYQ